MKTILLLTNFSETSRKAIISYLKLHSEIKSNCKFNLLNVFSAPKTGQSQMHKLDEILEEYSKQDLIKEKNLIKKMPELNKLDIDLISKKGSLIKVIELLNEKQTIDLIVIGSKGSNILKQLILGSNTNKVLRLSKSPVLIIPESIDFTRPKKIVFATDLKECRFEKHFERLVKIIRFFGSELLILNVYKETKPDAKLFEAMMNNHLKDIQHSFYYMQNSEPASGISSFLSEHKTDLLAMIERPGNLLEKLFRHSVTNKLALNAKMPLLIFHS